MWFFAWAAWLCVYVYVCVGEPTFVLDCIDDVQTKCELLAFCKARALKVVTSMGAGAKADPTRIHVADITEAISTHVVSITESLGGGSGVGVVVWLH